MATTVPLHPVRVTPILVGVLVAAWLAMVVSGVSPTDPDTATLLKWGADFGPLTLRGQAWRLVSSMFLHAGVLHLAFNGWALWTLGRVTERLLGGATFLLIYLLSGVAASLTSVLMHPLIVSVGASGAIFGTAGTLVALQYWRQLPATALVLRRDMAGIGSFVIYNLVYGAAHSGIDNAAHIGGLLAGLGLAAFVPLPTAQGEPPPRGRTVSTFAAAGAALALWAAFVWHERAPVAEFGAAVDLIDKGQTDSGIVALQRVVSRWPREARVHYALGAAYLRAKRLDEAITSLRTAVALDSLEPTFENDLGVAYLRRGQRDSAVVAFQKTVGLAPRWPSGQANLGLAYLSAGRAAEAIAPLRTAVELDPVDSRHQLLLGNAYLATQALAQGVASFDAALAHASDSARVYARRGVAYRLMHRDADARADFEHAVSLATPVTDDQDIVVFAREQLAELGAVTAPLRRRAVRVLINIPIDFKIEDQ